MGEKKKGEGTKRAVSQVTYNRQQAVVKAERM